MPLWPGWVTGLGTAASIINLLPQASSSLCEHSRRQWLPEGFGPSQVWWYTPPIPALGKRRQENQEFNASFTAGLGLAQSI